MNTSRSVTKAAVQRARSNAIHANLRRVTNLINPTLPMPHRDPDLMTIDAILTGLELLGSLTRDVQSRVLARRGTRR